jgi:hypothetical protein
VIGTTTELVFTRWEKQRPHEAAVSRDPRGDACCRVDGCQTFAWRGYDGLCGWCHDEQVGGTRP